MYDNKTEVEKWHKAGKAIFDFAPKLDDKHNNIPYSKYFYVLYYGFSTSQRPNASEVSQVLLKTMGRLTLEQKNLLKSFIAISQKGLKEENYEGFKKILRSNNWLPLDPAEEERLARERIAAEKRKKEAEDRRIREEAERRWAEEERRRRQEEERVRRAERARKRKQKKILMVVGILIGVFVIFQVSSFAYSNYKYTLKRNHMITVGDEYLANGDYDNAISSYQSALPLKQSTSKRNQINDLIHNAKNVKYKEINDLLSKIETIIQSNKTSLKYGVMNYDDPKYMIDRVLQLDGENKRAKDFLAQLEKQKRRSRK